MEHIVQFAISIDDLTIQDKVENRAATEVIRAMQSGGILSRYCNDKLNREFAEDVGTKFCEDHKDEIIAGIVKYCGDKLLKRKSFVDKVTEEYKAAEGV